MQVFQSKDIVVLSQMTLRSTSVYIDVDLRASNPLKKGQQVCAMRHAIPETILIDIFYMFRCN